MKQFTHFHVKLRILVFHHLYFYWASVPVWNSVCTNRNDYINLCSVLSLGCNDATSTKLRILQISLLYVHGKKRAFLHCICLLFSTSVNKNLSLPLALSPSFDKMPSTFSAECFPDRTDVQCLHRWQKVLNPELVKGPWSKEVSILLAFLFWFYFLLILSLPQLAWDKMALSLLIRHLMITYSTQHININLFSFCL